MKKQGQFEDRAAELGRRDANRAMYRDTHKSKHERDRERRFGPRVIIVGYSAVSETKGGR